MNKAKSNFNDEDFLEPGAFQKGIYVNSVFGDDHPQDEICHLSCIMSYIQETILYMKDEEYLSEKSKDGFYFLMEFIISRINYLTNYVELNTPN